MAVYENGTSNITFIGQCTSPQVSWYQISWLIQDVVKYLALFATLFVVYKLGTKFIKQIPQMLKTAKQRKIEVVVKDERKKR